MLNLEDFMNIRDLKQQGWSVSAIAEQLSLDRKTVRRHLLEAPHGYKRENPAPCKIDPYRPFLRERWEKGVHNAHKLLEEIRGRGYDGGYSQLKQAVNPWREEGRERAFVRFETGPGPQVSAVVANDRTENDRIETLITSELFAGRVDALISEDRDHQPFSQATFPSPTDGGQRR